VTCQLTPNQFWGEKINVRKRFSLQIDDSDICGPTQNLHQHILMFSIVAMQ
jgi:hypothetical protein